MQTEREALAWAAGFFEGEGCFYQSYGSPRKDGTQRAHAEASLTQKNWELLEQFRVIVGFGSVTGPNPKGIYVWRTTKRGETNRLAEMLCPWLSPRRLTRAAEVVRTERSQVDGRSKPGAPWNKGRSKGRKAECHADRKHFALGLCRPCWDVEYQRRRRDTPVA